jgi:hypothetical protein
MNENRVQGLHLASANTKRIGGIAEDTFSFLAQPGGCILCVTASPGVYHHLNEGVKGDRPWLTPKKIHLKAVNDSQMQGQHQDIRRARNIESLGN